VGLSVGQLCKAAGVGRSTAYRVLSKDSAVSPAARQKVLEAIERLGYPAMRPRSRRRSGLVLWLPGIRPPKNTGPFLTEIIAAIERVAVSRKGNRGFRIISKKLPDSPEQVPLELLRENISGMLTVAFYSNPHLESMGRRWPVVSLFSSRQIPGVVTINPDYSGAARLAVEHLAQRGHKRIALVTGLVRERNFSRLFLDGYAGEMARRNLTIQPKFISSHADNVGGGIDPKLKFGGEKAINDFFSGEQQRPTAIIARHDSLLGILRRLQEMGLRVPDDVSIIGCGSRELNQSLETNLTTVTFDAEHLARLGIAMINAVQKSGARLLVPVALSTGDSVRSIVEKDKTLENE
jgi:LacI family transcriptional regulator, galactose operon repressor